MSVVSVVGTAAGSSAGALFSSLGFRGLGRKGLRPPFCFAMFCCMTQKFARARLLSCFAATSSSSSSSVACPDPPLPVIDCSGKPCFGKSLAPALIQDKLEKLYGAVDEGAVRLSAHARPWRSPAAGSQGRGNVVATLHDADYSHLAQAFVPITAALQTGDTLAVSARS